MYGFLPAQEGDWPNKRTATRNFPQKSLGIVRQPASVRMPLDSAISVSLDGVFMGVSMLEVLSERRNGLDWVLSSKLQAHDNYHTEARRRRERRTARGQMSEVRDQRPTIDDKQTTAKTTRV